MSYGFMSRVAVPERLRPGSYAVPPWSGRAARFRRPREDVDVAAARVPGPATYSAASTPMRRSRHSSESAPPVEIAMLRDVALGVVLAASVSDLSGCGLSTHLRDVRSVYLLAPLADLDDERDVAPSGAS